MAVGKLPPQQPQQQVGGLSKNQQLGLFLSSLSDVFAGKDPTSGLLQRQQFLQQQQIQAQEKQRQQRLQQLAQSDPSLARMYELFGERGLQQDFLQKQEQEREQQLTEQKIQNLINAGFSQSEISMILAGIAPKDVMEFRQQDIASLQYKTPEELTKEVEEQKLQDPESIKKLENIEEAFGGVDALQQVVNKTIGPIFGTPFKETAEAVTAKDVLNERIREKFVNQYAGRPSVYINQRVDLLLPKGEYIDESVALSKYQETKRVLEEGLNEMKTKLDSNLYTGTERLDVQQNYKDIQSIVSDIDVAIKGLKGATKDPEILSPSTIFKPTGAYDSFYTANTK